MGRRYFSNAAQAGYCVSSVVGSGSSTVFQVTPTPGGGAAPLAGWPTVPFFAVIDRGLATEELVKVTAVSGFNWTVTRGGSLAGEGFGATTQAHAANAVIEHVASAADLDEANAHVNASSGVHGVVGALVGTSDTQTLSGKTLSSPVINSPTVSGGTVAGAAVSGGSVATSDITLKGSVSAAPTVEGRVEWDTDDDKLKVGTGSGTKTFSDDAVTVVHGATGAVVGTTNAQTLTNKTLTAPSLTSPVVTSGALTLAADPSSALHAATKQYVDGRSYIADTGWIDATLSNGWTAVGTGRGLSFRQIGNVVHVRGGLVKATFAGTVWEQCATVPASIGAPLVEVNVNSMSYGTGHVHRQANINTDRTVSVSQQVATATSSPAYFQTSYLVD